MFTIGVLIFPMVEELDFVGPFEVLSYINKLKPGSTKVFLVAERKEPVKAFNGMTILPDVTIDKCPQLDILVVPGGKGRYESMDNDKIRDFVIKQAQGTQFITSVCTGAFILAEAGLLKGKNATTYHTALDELAGYPEVMVKKAKVVSDGNIITAAGVSSGMELGFYLLKELFNKEIAQEVADKIEYQINIEKICR